MIVCGLPGVGLRIVEQLTLSGVPAVVVDEDPDPPLARLIGAWGVPLITSTRAEEALANASVLGHPERARHSPVSRAARHGGAGHFRDVAEIRARTLLHRGEPVLAGQRRGDHLPPPGVGEEPAAGRGRGRPCPHEEEPRQLPRDASDRICGPHIRL